MSDFFNKYPYTDFHELNLDWIIERVKKLTEDWASTLEEWNNTEEQWQQLYNYVHDYFDNLDVQQEINNKMNQMIADGTFKNIAQPIIEAQTITTTTSWLAAHITQPTTPAIDTSLAIAGAAADSKTVGDRFTDDESMILNIVDSALPARFIDGYHIDPTTGERIVTTGWSCTDYIPIDLYYQIKCRQGQNYTQNAYYSAKDENSFISSLS